MFTIRIILPLKIAKVQNTPNNERISVKPLSLVQTTKQLIKNPNRFAFLQ